MKFNTAEFESYILGMFRVLLDRVKSVVMANELLIIMWFRWCAMGRQWCGILHNHWRTASINSRLLFRADCASWGLYHSSGYYEKWYFTDVGKILCSCDFNMIACFWSLIMFLSLSSHWFSPFLTRDCNYILVYSLKSHTGRADSR